MATVSATDLNTKPLWSGDCGNLGVFYGTYTGTPATGDVWRFCKIPAGIKVLKVTIINEDLGTAAPCDFGYAPTDGSTASATAFASAVALGTASTADVGTNKLFADAPVSVAKDSYLIGTFGTISVGNSGKVSVIVEGELFGAK